MQHFEEQDIDAVYELECKRNRAAAMERMFSPAVQHTPLVETLIAAGVGLDYSAMLDQFVAEQWALYRATQEMDKASEEVASSSSSLSSDSPNAVEECESLAIAEAKSSS